MKKLKNKIIFLSILFTCFLWVSKVDAASVSVSSNSSYITVGNTFTVSIGISSDVEAWDFSVGYDNSRLRVISSNLENGMRSVNTSYNHARSYSITFKAIASGSASVYISDAALASGSSYLSATKGSKTFTLRTQAEIEASYSKNNYLSSLSVDGVDLSPAFDKEISEYTVQLEPETTKININASVADSTASVQGAGEREVTDGDNKIELVVTAQNGTTRTYVINAKVKEYDPINVEIDKKTYTIIRKKTSLTAPNNYNETTVVINDVELPAFKSEVTGYTLVGLKDEEGNANLYVYDVKKETYTLYKEYEFNKVILYPLESEKIPNNYKKTTITYNEEKIPAYKLKESSKYALIYGMNIETGKKNWYMYEQKENTIQIYNDEEVNLLTDQNNLYLKIIIGLGILSFTLIVLTIIFAVKSKK